MAAEYGPRFDEALLLASRLHRAQVRKSTPVPYITHLLAVAAIVGETQGDETRVIAALLHDAVEDQGGAPTLTLIRAQFGDEVAEIVAGCTDTDIVPKPPWRARKEAYIAHLATASPAVAHVSCADKLHNARSVLMDYRASGEVLWARFTGGREGTLWYYRTITNALRATAAPPALVDELDRTVSAVEQLATAG